MKQRIRPQLRGMNVLLFIEGEQDKYKLSEVLLRLGMNVSSESLKNSINIDLEHEKFDLIFIDGDAGPDNVWLPSQRPYVPVVGVIGNEAPGRLERLVEHDCDSYVVKPLRNAGIYSAVLLGITHHQRMRKICHEIVTLKTRLSGRKYVFKAVMQLMEELNVSDEVAYKKLQTLAMESRCPIEDVAKKYISNSLDGFRKRSFG